MFRAGLVFAQLDDWRAQDAVSGRYCAPTGTNTIATPVYGRVRGYGATYGSGTTDRQNTGFTAEFGTRTYAVWVMRNGLGGGSLGRVFDKQSSATSAVEQVYTSNVAPYDYQYERRFSTAVGSWGSTQTLPADGTPYLLAISYNSGSTTNDPVSYVNGVGATMTRNTAPSGTLTSSANPYTLGNRVGDGLRNWDGWLAGVCIWDRILTPAEHWALYDPATRWDLYWQPSTRVYVDMALPASDVGYLLVMN